MKTKQLDLEYRMYHLVLYNISPIQQAIQAYHAGIEYSLKHGSTPEFKKWASEDKTVIILNGGTSTRKENLHGIGTMEQHYNTLSDNKIKVAKFHEPDLNFATTAIAFLVDERVWDLKSYPMIMPAHASAQPYKLDPNKAYSFKELDENAIFVELKRQYGKEVAFLRAFLKNFKLA